MVKSIETRNYVEGLNIHTHIVSTSNFSETSAFMPVLKVVLTQANKLGVWRNPVLAKPAMEAYPKKCISTATMQEADQTLVLTACCSRALTNGITLSLQNILGGPWSPGAFLFILIVPSSLMIGPQIVYLMDDSPYCRFLDACYTAKQRLLITDVCVKTKG